MKAVILAAGMGKRLGQNIPKALVKIRGDTTIMDLQIQNLKTLIDADDILVVIGFKGDLLYEKYSNLSFVWNDNYAKTNTAKSLLEGLKKVNDDVLWINGDVVFEKEILSSTKFSDENLICVNNNILVGKEEIKYTTDDNGYINNISKSVESGLGEAVGINFITKEDLPIFRASLELCDNNDYFERGIVYAINEGLRFLPNSINNSFCVEIDFYEDLEKAKRYLVTSGGLD